MKTYTYTSPANAAIRVHDTQTGAKGIVRQGSDAFVAILADQAITVAPYAPPAAPSLRKITPRAFMLRLPAPVQEAVAAATVQSPSLHRWVLELVASREVDLDMPETQAGVAAMVQAGLLTQAQATALLA